MKKKLLLTLMMLAAILMFAGCKSKEADAVPTPGTWTDNVYENEYAGLTFTMPEGWTALSDEEISEMMGVGTEIMKESGLEFSEEMLELQSIYAMMAQNPTTGTNVSLMFENLALSAGGTKLTETDYIDALKSQLEQVGIPYTFGETTERTIGGNTYVVLEADATDYGAKQFYCVRKSGKYMIASIITITGDDSVEDVFNCFN